MTNYSLSPFCPFFSRIYHFALRNSFGAKIRHRHFFHTQTIGSICQISYHKQHETATTHDNYEFVEIGSRVKPSSPQLFLFTHAHRSVSSAIIHITLAQLQQETFVSRGGMCYLFCSPYKQRLMNCYYNSGIARNATFFWFSNIFGFIFRTIH